MTVSNTPIAFLLLSLMMGCGADVSGGGGGDDVPLSQQTGPGLEPAKDSPTDKELYPERYTPEAVAHAIETLNAVTWGKKESDFSDEENALFATAIKSEDQNGKVTYQFRLRNYEDETRREYVYGPIYHFSVTVNAYGAVESCLRMRDEFRGQPNVKEAEPGVWKPVEIAYDTYCLIDEERVDEVFNSIKALVDGASCLNAPSSGAISKEVAFLVTHFPRDKRAVAYDHKNTFATAQIEGSTDGTKSHTGANSLVKLSVEFFTKDGVIKSLSAVVFKMIESDQSWKQEAATEFSCFDN